MKCDRCNGFVIAMSFIGSDEALGAWEYEGVKCLNCGHIADPLSKRHRALSAQNASMPDSVLGQMVKAGLGVLPSVESRCGAGRLRTKHDMMMAT